MNLAETVDRVTAGVDHEAWRTMGATLASYLLVLLGVFVVLFVVPFLLFLLL
jgi:hypothetical protein